MSEITHKCARCGTPHTTFDVKGINWRYKNYSWQNGYEIFSVCRSCKRGSILVAETRGLAEHDRIEGYGGISKTPGVLNHVVKVIGVINIKDVAAIEPPDHLPSAIRAAFSEGASCLAIGCVNAAAAMFRLCVDLATVELVPLPDQNGPNQKTGRDLGLRLPWLFAAGKLPQDLLDLSVCIKDDGNDGVHRGSLSSEEAEDLLDFTVELLRRLYTEKERIRLARERKNARQR